MHESDGVMMDFDEYFCNLLYEHLSIPVDRSIEILPKNTTNSSINMSKNSWKALQLELINAATKNPKNELKEFTYILLKKIYRSTKKMKRIGFKQFCNKRLNFKEVQSYKDIRSDNFVFVKVGDGYWAQLHSTIAPYHWIEEKGLRMEYLNQVEGFRERNLESLATLMLIKLLKSYKNFEPNLNSTKIFFGCSMTGVDIEYKQLIRDFGTERIFQRWNFVPLITSVCIDAWWKCIGELKHIEKVDGCLPKLLCQSDELEEYIESYAANCDEAIFIVPDFLEGIAFKNIDISQTTYLISSTEVHSMWMIALYNICKKIYMKIESGKNVLILIEAASIAVIFGILIAKIKDDLLPGIGNLKVFDLGQTMEAARKDKLFGPWMKRKDMKTDHNLFTIKET